MAWMVRCSGCKRQAKFPEERDLLAKTFCCSKCGKATKIKCCDYCREPIDARRLEAVPEANSCASCKSGYEGNDYHQVVDEPLGSRQDFLKDRGSYP